MYLIYQIVLLIAFLFILPGCLWQMYTTGKYRKSLSWRFGNLPEEIRVKFQEGRWIWVHAVSVGETAAVAPLIKEFKAKYPQYKVLLSTVTESGHEMARKNLPQIDEHIYFPLDFGFAVNKVLDIVNPKIMILAETEIWPNFLRHLKLRKIPVLLVNGRISPKSYKNYMRLKPFMRRVLENIDIFSMQTKEDGERIISMGADPAKVIVNGNLKFDLPQKLLTPAQRKELRDKLKLPQSSLLLVAGSTHPGEEEIILESFKILREKFEDFYMILVPRHPERFLSVENMLVKANLSYVRKTKLVDGSNLEPIILLDTIGELAAIYSLASVVFMGGTMVPIGGHNILEPAQYSKAVVFGPYMSNFAEIARLFKEKNASAQVQNLKELNEELIKLLADSHLRSRMGQAAIGVLEANRGATGRNLEIIGRYLS